MILHLIRHSRPLIEPAICYGRLDVAAADIEHTAQRLRLALPPGLPVWTSPLQRCRLLAGLLHPLPISDQRLAEMNFGAWEGCSWDKVPRQEIDAWAADVLDYVPPGGESARHVQRRALDCIAGLAVPEAVIVTHAGVIRMLLADPDGPLEKCLSMPSPSFGSLLRARYWAGRVRLDAGL